MKLMQEKNILIVYTKHNNEKEGTVVMMKMINLKAIQWKTPLLKFLGFIRLQRSFTWISFFPSSFANTLQFLPFFSTNLCHAWQS